VERLRELEGRRVWRDGDTVVKSFERHGALLRCLDRRRAEREIDVLTRLHAAGLAVPRPIGVERTPRGFAARLAFVDGARALDVCLAETSERRDEPRVRRLRRAWLRAAAVLVARAGALGLDQPDWHPGNVLVDAHARAFAIDFHKARLGRPSARLVARDALLLAMHTRELCDAREAASAVRAHLVALPADLGRAVLAGRSRSVHVARLCGNARRERRAHVERELDRWTRPSGAVEAMDGGWRARERIDAAAARFVVTGSPAEVRSVWRAQARLVEHRVPAAVPQVLVPGRAEFAVPSARRGAGSVARLAELFADRLLADGLLSDGRLAGRRREGVEPDQSVAWTGPDGTVHAIPRGARQL
jgi:hypothetical protein